MDQAILDLVAYGLRTHLLEEDDRTWAVNRLLDALHLTDWTEPAQAQDRPLEDILKEYLHLDQVTLIRCGGDSPIASEREQWNDGANTLCIAPGKVVVYDRNYVTNRLLEDAGVEVLKFSGSELSRGRGGPRCMSMPLERLPV